MALNVVLVRKTENISPEYSAVIALEDDGNFSYLKKFWPASSSNGKVIDLYDLAIYKGPNLGQFRGCFQRAKQNLLTEPDTWEFSTGYGRHRKTITVRKAEILKIINQLQQTISKAESEGLEIHFHGD